MILTIDVGNTNITCGVFQGDEIAASFRITTKMPRTSERVWDDAYESAGAERYSSGRN